MNKAFIFIAAVLPCVAAAQVRYEATNTGGGKIILTERECPKMKGLLHMYSVSVGGGMIEGCWTLMDDRVHVAWYDGDRTSYDPGVFRVIGTRSAPAKKGTEL